MSNELTQTDELRGQVGPSGVQWNGLAPQAIDHAEDVWMTADEIGSALEYDDPSRQINKLFRRNIELLEPYTCEAKLVLHGQLREVRLFNEEGVILLCLKSNQPKAIAFQRWAAAELKARRRARYMDVATRNAFLEDRVTFLTHKLIELHERHERVPPRKARLMGMADGLQILDLWGKGFTSTEIAGQTGWSMTMVYFIVHGNHRLCRDIERAYPDKAHWRNAPKDEAAARRYMRGVDETLAEQTP